MSTREFDPVLSAALRNELEARADSAAAEIASPLRRRPQVWITVVTALLLLVATLGVLRVTGGAVPDVAGGGAFVDPLLAGDGPRQDASLQDTPVTLLLDERSTGTTWFDYAVPDGATRLAVYLTCAPSVRASLVAADGSSGASSCRGGTAMSRVEQQPRTGHGSIQVRVPEGTRIALVVLAVAPSSTTALSALDAAAARPAVADPLTEVLDPAGDAFIRHDADVLLQAKGAGVASGTWTMTVPTGVTSVRPYVNCAADEQYEIGIDQQRRSASAGCGATFGGSFVDIPIRPGQHEVSLRLPGRTAFALLVIATPVYSPSTPGPAKRPLPYPKVAGQEVLARERGDSRILTGRLPGSMSGVDVVITCRGTGSITVATDFGTVGSPPDRSSCGTSTAVRGGGSLTGAPTVRRPEYTITPYGDVSWTVTFLRLSE